MTEQAISLSYHRILSEIKQTTADPPRRALLIAEHLDSVKGEAIRACRELGMLEGLNLTGKNREPSNLRRARAVIKYSSDLISKVHAGDMSLNNAYEQALRRRPSKQVTSNVTHVTRVDASWIGKEINNKLAKSLDVICDLPLASDVAEVLKRNRHNSSDLNDKIVRAAAWLKELKDAFDL